LSLTYSHFPTDVSFPLTTEPCMLLWSFNIQYEYITRVFAGHRLGSDKLILDLSR